MVFNVEMIVSSLGKKVKTEPPHQVENKEILTISRIYRMH